MTDEPVVSLMLAVRDAQAAAQWYEVAMGATRTWDLGSVVGLSVQGAPLFLGEPAGNGVGGPRQRRPADGPDRGLRRRPRRVRRTCGRGRRRTPRTSAADHAAPWGTHRQGGFVDPFGHLWFVGTARRCRFRGRAPPDEAD